MKKLIFMMALSIMVLVSCEREHYCDCNNNNVPSNTVALSTFYIDVEPEDWAAEPVPPPIEAEYDDAEKYVSASFEAPEITENVINNGLVVAYFVDGKYVGEDYVEYDNQLPYVFPVVTSTSDTIYENMRFDYTRGEITFIIEDSDMGFTFPNNDRTFKVCVFSPN